MREELLGTTTCPSGNVLVVELGGATLCGFFTGVGDGVFPVEVHRDDDGEVTRVRVVLADDP